MEINLDIDQADDIVVDNNIRVRIQRYPQGYWVSTYSVQDGSHISTSKICEDAYYTDYADEANLEETKETIMETLVGYFGVDCMTLMEDKKDNFIKFCDELLPALMKSINKVNLLEVIGCFNPHCYGFKHCCQTIEIEDLISALESLPCAINTTSLSAKDAQEIADECAKVFEAYDTLNEWREAARGEWYKMLEEEALKHGCTYYED
jgi:hypothetical protein